MSHRKNIHTCNRYASDVYRHKMRRGHRGGCRDALAYGGMTGFQGRVIRGVLLGEGDAVRNVGQIEGDIVSSGSNADVVATDGEGLEVAAEVDVPVVVATNLPALAVSNGELAFPNHGFAERPIR